MGVRGDARAADDEPAGRNRPSRRLPRVYLITDRRRCGIDVAELVAEALRDGVRMVQIREKDLEAGALETLVRAVVRDARAYEDAAVLVNDRLDVARASRADGVHLPSDGLPVSVVRRIAPEGFLVGRSTHRVDEAVEAGRAGADFVVFGPVFATASKPAARPVGLGALARAARACPVPVYALGGITAERVAEVLAAGAWGVAAVGALADPDARRRILEAVDATD